MTPDGREPVGVAFLAGEGLGPGTALALAPGRVREESHLRGPEAVAGDVVEVEVLQLVGADGVLGALAGLGVARGVGRRAGTRFRSASQTSASESLGARQSPRGESEPPEPTLGALGTQERLNWLVLKKR